MHTAILALVALALAGCATTGAENLTAEQLQAMAKTKDANVICFRVDGITTDVTLLMINLDRGVLQTGSIDAGQDCKTTITNQK